MTPEEHNKTLGTLHLVYGGLHALLLLAASFFALPAFYVFWSEPGRHAPPLAFLLMVFGGILLASLLFFIPALVAGYGLIKRKSWGRTAGMVAAFLMALNVPIGTALAVYSFWFLSSRGAHLYEDESARFARYELGGAPPQADPEWFGGGDKARERAGAYAPPPQPPDWR